MTFRSILHAKPRLENAFPQPWHGRTNWSKVVRLTTFVSTMPELPPSDMVKARFAKAGNWMYILHGCTMSMEHVVALPSSPPPLTVWRLVSLPGIIDWSATTVTPAPSRRTTIWFAYLSTDAIPTFQFYDQRRLGRVGGTSWFSTWREPQWHFSLAGVALCLCRQSRRTVLLVCNSFVANRQCEIVKIVRDVSSFVAGLRTSKQERQFWSYASTWQVQFFCDAHDLLFRLKLDVPVMKIWVRNFVVLIYCRWELQGRKRVWSLQVSLFNLRRTQPMTGDFRRRKCADAGASRFLCLLKPRRNCLNARCSQVLYTRRTREFCSLLLSTLEKIELSVHFDALRRSHLRRM